MSLHPSFAPPSEAEMDLRLSRVRHLMSDRGLTHYVAACPHNVFYLTNLRTMFTNGLSLCW